MANYIKIVTAVPTATTAETFFLLPMENLIQAVSTATTNLRFYYGGISDTDHIIAIDVTIAAGETQAALDAFATQAMQAAVQNSGTISQLIPYGINGGAPTLATGETLRWIAL